LINTEQICHGIQLACRCSSGFADEPTPVTPGRNVYAEFNAA
jgi:hypothetical protein